MCDTDIKPDVCARLHCAGFSVVRCPLSYCVVFGCALVVVVVDDDQTASSQRPATSFELHTHTIDSAQCEAITLKTHVQHPQSARINLLPPHSDGRIANGRATRSPTSHSSVVDEIVPRFNYLITHFIINVWYMPSIKMCCIANKSCDSNNSSIMLRIGITQTDCRSDQVSSCIRYAFNNSQGTRTPSHSKRNNSRRSHSPQVNARVALRQLMLFANNRERALFVTEI